MAAFSSRRRLWRCNAPQIKQFFAGRGDESSLRRTKQLVINHLAIGFTV